MKPKVSSCCGTTAHMVEDLDHEDLEVCSKCLEPCEYITVEQFESGEWGEEIDNNIKDLYND